MSTAYGTIAMTIHDIIVDSAESVYTLKEFGEALGVSVQTLNRWDKVNLLKAHRIEHNNRLYRYYTETQRSKFVKSDVYLSLNQIKNKDIIGKKFGKLTVLRFSDSAIKKGYYGSYLCQCSCGTVLEIPRSELIRGKVKSCGCKFADLTGLSFGRWHVDSLANCRYTPCGSKLYMYNCTCECGTKRTVISTALTSGASQSCGCLHKEIISKLFLNDLTGKSFGHLVVMERDDTYWSPSGLSMRTMWKCECQLCGKQTIVSSDNLLSGRIESCGCDMIDGYRQGASKYEYHVRKYLEQVGVFENGLENRMYSQYKTFPDLIGVGGGYLLYDFYVVCNGCQYLIECQGEQHYKSVEWFGGQAAFEKQQEHDKRKRNYANQNGITFIEIPYTAVCFEMVATLLKSYGIM